MFFKCFKLEIRVVFFLMHLLFCAAAISLILLTLCLKLCLSILAILAPVAVE